MMLYSKNFSSNKATFLRNDNKIKYTIFPVLFHFYCVVKSLNNILFAVFTPYKKEILLRNMVYFISPSFLKLRWIDWVSKNIFSDCTVFVLSLKVFLMIIT